MNIVATLTAATALVATTTAFAQTSPAPTPAPAQSPRAARPDLASLVDARVAAIQAGLKLTPEQQQFWPPVEQAIRSFAAERGETAEPQRQGADVPDFMQRLERRAERASQQGQRLHALATAVEPLWASLDERQKRLLPILIRPVEGFAGRQVAMRGSQNGRRAPAQRP
jgi:zinc resistance-associated protein